MNTLQKPPKTILKGPELSGKRPRGRPRKTPEQAAHDKEIREYIKRQKAIRLQNMADSINARAIKDWFDW
jgi:hypothetical protein